MGKDKDKHPHLTIVSDEGDKLTAKQEHFCQLVAQGQTLTDAYKTAYNVKEGTKAFDNLISPSEINYPEPINRIEIRDIKEEPYFLINESFLFLSLIHI